MRLFLEFVFRGIYTFLVNPQYRKFLIYFLRLGGMPRTKSIKIRLNRWMVKVLDPLSFVWQFHEIFYEQGYLFPADKEDLVIYDCGSNIGLSLLFFSEKYPNARIEAYEPSPMVFNVLQENIRKNIPNPHRVHLHSQAVWVANENRRIYQGMGSDAGNFDQFGPEVGVVEAVDLCDILEKEDHVDFLKVDIEGAENKVIPHLVPVLPKIGALFIEYHSRPDSPQDLSVILKTLEESGFRYYLKTINRNPRPYFNHLKGRDMDFQTNVYAFRTT
jgi:FkbM family methyltransferase